MTADPHGQKLFRYGGALLVAVALVAALQQLIAVWPQLVAWRFKTVTLGGGALGALAVALALRADEHAQPYKRILARILVAGALFSGMLLFLLRLQYRWDWRIVQENWYRFENGLALTLELSLWAMGVGLFVGTLACVMRLSRNEAVRFLAVSYVELIRGTPLLVQLLIAYFCIFPQLGYDDPEIIGLIALGIFSGAYIAEILRAGVDSVEKGQWEAAHAVGFTRFQTLRLVIAPQAFRRVIPPLTGQFVSLVKDSSLLSVVAVVELTKVAQLLQARSYKVFEIFLTVALLYLALTFPLSWLSNQLERRLASRG